MTARRHLASRLRSKTKQQQKEIHISAVMRLYQHPSNLLYIQRCATPKIQKQSLERMYWCWDAGGGKMSARKKRGALYSGCTLCSADSILSGGTHLYCGRLRSGCMLLIQSKLLCCGLLPSGGMLPSGDNLIACDFCLERMWELGTGLCLGGLRFLALRPACDMSDSSDM